MTFHLDDYEFSGADNHNGFQILSGTRRKEPTSRVWKVSPGNGEMTSESARNELFECAEKIKAARLEGVCSVLEISKSGGGYARGYVVIKRGAMTLKDWMQRHGAELTGEELDDQTKKIVQGIANILKGVAGLNNKGIILGALTPDMIELDEDIGLARVCCVPLLPIASGRIVPDAPAFTAPEVVNSRGTELEKAVDVYSVAMLSMAWLFGDKFEEEFLQDQEGARSDAAWRNWHRDKQRPLPDLRKHRNVIGVQEVQNVLERMLGRSEVSAPTPSAELAMQDLNDIMHHVNLTPERSGFKTRNSSDSGLPQEPYQNEDKFVPERPPRLTYKTAALLGALLVVSTASYWWLYRVKPEATQACKTAELAIFNTRDTTTIDLVGAARFVVDGNNRINNFRYKEAISLCQEGTAKVGEAAATALVALMGDEESARSGLTGLLQQARSLGVDEANLDLTSAVETLAAEGFESTGDAWAAAKANTLAEFTPITQGIMERRDHTKAVFENLQSLVDERTALRSAANAARDMATKAEQNAKFASRIEAFSNGQELLASGDKELDGKAFEPAADLYRRAEEHFAQAHRKFSQLTEVAKLARVDAMLLRDQLAKVGSALNTEWAAWGDEAVSLGDQSLADGKPDTAHASYIEAAKHFRNGKIEAVNLAMRNAASQARDLATLAEEEAAVASQIDAYNEAKETLQSAEAEFEKEDFEIAKGLYEQAASLFGVAEQSFNEHSKAAIEARSAAVALREQMVIIEGASGTMDALKGDEALAAGDHQLDIGRPDIATANFEEAATHFRSSKEEAEERGDEVVFACPEIEELGTLLSFKAEKNGQFPAALIEIENRETGIQLGETGCIQASPVSFTAIMAFADSIVSNDPEAYRHAKERVEQGADGQAVGVTHWLAQRYARWMSTQIDEGACVADALSLNSAAAQHGQSFTAASFGELAVDRCANDALGRRLIFTGAPIGSSTAQCRTQLNPTGQASFRLVIDADCKP